MSHPYKKDLSFGVTDVITMGIVFSFILVFFFKMNSVIDYNWNWKAVFLYLFKKDHTTGQILPNLLITGFINTIKLSVYATIIAFFIGLFFGLLRTSNSIIQRFSGFIYVETIRNIPSIVLVFIFYFFISSHFLDKLGIDSIIRDSPIIIQNFVSFIFAPTSSINLFISAVITLAIYEGAYITEIIRGAINNIPKGQWDAGYALGMNKLETFRTIIAPQAIREVLSPLAGQFISTIKDSAIMSVISIQELTFQGMEIMAATFLTFEIWITITLFYFILTFSLSRIALFLEKKSNNY